MALSLAITLEENQYSFAALENNETLLFSQFRTFQEATKKQMIAALATDIERYDLIGHDCTLVLVNGQYQLLLTEAPYVPDAELGKALRWSVKGLTDYLVEDMLVEGFRIPTQSQDNINKAFAVITSLSDMLEKRRFLEEAYLNVTAIHIAEFALRKYLKALFPSEEERYKAPLLLVSLNHQSQKLYLIYQDTFYQIRELFIELNPEGTQEIEVDNMITEIERSINYCTAELDLPKPEQVILIPSSFQATSIQEQIQEKIKLNSFMIDINKMHPLNPPLLLKDQHTIFYSIAGAITFTSEPKEYAENTAKR